MLVRIKKGVLLLKLAAYTLGLYVRFFRQSYSGGKRLKGTAPADNDAVESGSKTRNIVIVGASFSGYHVARLIATSLPLDGSWKIIIVEPNHHYQFTWTLPRFCVIEGHEDKTFIPYGPYLPPQSDQIVRWIHHRAESITESAVRILETGEEVRYDHLVIATGNGVGLQLPSRVGATGKQEGVKLMQKMQKQIKAANRLVVVGGGAAGVELATDAKQQYPEKSVTLIHSRPAVMHRFGPELQAAALKGLEVLGVEVLLNERTVDENEETGTLTLRSGKTLPYDFCVNCTGQTPSSGLLEGLAPEAVTKSGHIRVKPTLQIDAPFPNIYACGDVADTGVLNANARHAMKQAQFVADNVLLAVAGLEPTHIYKPQWPDNVIKLTLGLDKSISHLSDGATELLFYGKEKDEKLMIEQVWRHMGAVPYEDVDRDRQVAANGKAKDTLMEVANELP